MTEGNPSSWEADRSHWDRIEELFHQAEELPAEQREAFLAEACGDQVELRARVESLLNAEIDVVGELGELLALPEQSGGEPYGTTDDGSEPFPDRIGPYRVLREVGRGGLSSVFLAERADGAFRKQVALKLIRRGLDTSDILDRLRQERQILARLDHPNIARLLDGGSTDDGRPYFVMEYVEGVPVDEYCRLHELGLDQRLDLFKTICSAVQYAHQNLTIHRDIKPSNILVTAEGVPKLLDFGIAKVLEADGQQTTWQMTSPGQRFMTPAYASPEQVRGEVLSTGTDIYSLGVLLFRLLTGAAPFDLASLPLHRLEKLICETPAPKAGQRLTPSSMAEVGWGQIGEQRLRGRLRGDLETIIAKALRKEPARRFRSAEQFLSDLGRFQAGLPVQARADSWRYRTTKFARRHWRGLAASILALISLAAIVGYYSYQLFQERNRALEASSRAQLEGSKAARVTQFLQQIFEVSNPSRSQGETITALQLLDEGAKKIYDELSEEPEVQASLLEVMGQSYLGLGLLEEAAELLARSFEIRQRLFSPPHEALALSHEKLGDLRIQQGRFEEAKEHLQQALAQRQQVLPEADPKIAASEGDLGALAYQQSQFKEAERRYLKALKRLEIEPGPRAEATLQLKGNLAVLLYEQGRLDEAESLGREVLLLQQEELGEKHPDTVNSEATLAAIVRGAGRYDEAEVLWRNLWSRQRELLGDEHPDTVLAASHLAATLYQLKRYEEAEPLYRDALELQLRVHGERHPRTLTNMLNLADLEADGFHNDDSARRLYERALQLRREAVGDDRSTLLTPLTKLGGLELRQGRPKEAAIRLSEAIEILELKQARALTSKVDWRLPEARSLLGEAYLRLGKLEEAEALLSPAIAALTKELGANTQEREPQNAG